jgi:MinD-like ATPase involved in chromosome partitioning or flagellar assembly
VKVITFYSIKGGVGRSLAAANFAIYLARLGLKTVIIDLNLEAPSLVAKLHLNMKPDQKGILNYLLSFQKGSLPESVEPYLIPVGIRGVRVSNETSIWLMPAGYWSSSNYQCELSGLDWNALLRKKKNENPFRRLLEQLQARLEPEYVIIDSRGGLSEATSVINLELADEVVIFSTLSNEDVDVICQLSVMIKKESSQRESGRNVSIKIVFSRVPIVSNIEELRRDCFKRLEDAREAGIDSSSIFFLASCKQLESGEFLVLAEPTDDPDVDRLVSDYVLLFSGLEPSLSKKVIPEALNIMNNRLLALSNPDADDLASQFAGLTPHPEVYRWAMRIFRLRNNLPEVSKYALKLITMLPDDQEALKEVARVYLANRTMFPPEEYVKWRGKVISTFEALYKAGKLDEKSCLQFAKLLKDANALEDALTIVSPLTYSEKLGSEERTDARSIALLAAVRLERTSLINEMLINLDRQSIQALSGETALHLMAWCHDHQKSTLALEIGLKLAQDGELNISRGLITFDRLEKTVYALAKLAKETNRLEELENAIISGTIVPMKKERQSKEHLEQLAKLFRQAGLPKSACQIQQLFKE